MRVHFMKYFTASFSIARDQQLSDILGAKIIRFLSPRQHAGTDGVIVGWGVKSNTRLSRKFAEKNNLLFLTLEDGFISYIDHPSSESQRLSLIKDELGIYYDSTKPSGLDKILESQLTWFSPEMEVRSKGALIQCANLGVSKYNQRRYAFPTWLRRAIALKREIILLIDQTYGDCSITGAQANQSDFSRMLDWAIDKASNAKPEQGLVIIKTHPDVLLGKKRGHFKPDDLPSNVLLLSEDVSPKALISIATAVATVSSQLGFEALWYGKPVHCFGIPFYAQRGLTIDHARHKVERSSVTLNQLFAAAIFKYPIYWHPEKQCICEFEEILEWMQAQFMTRDLKVESINVVATSLWKRSFIPSFIGPSANKIRFSKRAGRGRVQLHWGMKTDSLNGSESCWRIEDGFIRSVGLGADLRRPSSLVIDDIGIYYNGHASSRLEEILNQLELNAFELGRAERLLKKIVDSNITKYNVEAMDSAVGERYLAEAGGRDIILVVGQFQDDLSIRYGSEGVDSNLGLLKAARGRFPEAFIIFKEHPDVYSGVRAGKLLEADVCQWADSYVTDLSLTVCFSFITRLCTICSLSGFEALLRGVPVSTFGLPFYAGWGLTDDALNAFQRRRRQLSLLELVYGVLVLYPRYVNWDTRTLSTPEIIIDQLVQERDNNTSLKSTWVRRQGRKLSYLWQSFIR